MHFNDKRNFGNITVCLDDALLRKKLDSLGVLKLPLLAVSWSLCILRACVCASSSECLQMPLLHLKMHLCASQYICLTDASSSLLCTNRDAHKQRCTPTGAAPSQAFAGPSWLDGAGLLLEDFMTIVAKQCATKRCCAVHLKIYCFVSMNTN